MAGTCNGNKADSFVKCDDVDNSGKKDVDNQAHETVFAS